LLVGPNPNPALDFEEFRYTIISCESRKD
jgi:hypothetical protein